MIFLALLSLAVVIACLLPGPPKPPPMLHLMKWYYEWLEVGPYVQAYCRYRYEPTLDGGAKPFIELIAYIERYEDQWRILRADLADQVEIQPDLRLDLAAARRFAEQRAGK